MKDLAYWRPDSIAVSKTKQVNYKQTHTHTHTHTEKGKKKTTNKNKKRSPRLSEFIYVGKKYS